MKKILTGILILVSSVTFGQAYSTIGNVKTDIDTRIVTNSSRSITAAQLNKILNGLVNFKIDTLYTNVAQDTLFFVRYLDTMSIALPSGGSFDTTTIYNNLALKLNKSDSTTLYYPRFSNPENFLKTSIASSGNEILTGGQVTWISGLTYYVSPTTYIINGTQYSFAGGNVTLAAADPSLDRQDAIILTSSQTATSITGTPDANPLVPTADPLTELFLTSGYIAAGATTPSNISQVIIRDEGAGGEWTISKTLTSTDNYGTNPYNGSISQRITAAANNSWIQWTKPSGTVSKAAHNNLIFFIRNNATLSSNRSFIVTLYNGFTAVGQSLNLATYGYSRTITGSYQTVAVPMSAFTGADLFDDVRITNTGTGGTVDVQVDYIQLQSGVITAGGGGTGTVVSFSKTDNYGIISSVTNPTTTPNHAIAVDTTVIVAKPYLTNALVLKANQSALVDTALAIRTDLAETASNGLTKTVNDIKLGGTLTAATTINGGGNSFTIDNSPVAVTSFPYSYMFSANDASHAANAGLLIGNIGGGTSAALSLNTDSVSSAIRLVHDGSGMVGINLNVTDLTSTGYALDITRDAFKANVYGNESLPIDFRIGQGTGFRRLPFTANTAYRMLVQDTTDGRFYKMEIPTGGGGGETNTASNLGGGLANYSTKVGADLRFNSFDAADFDLASNLISIDATKWQTISGAASTYAPIASPTFTGTVSGITKSMVGLGNVDNTSDATKNSAVAALTNKDLTSGTNTFPTLNQNTTGTASKFTGMTFAELNTAVTDANIARTDAGQTFTGVQSMTTPDFTTGFTIGTAAASGKFIVGNGTNYVPSTSTIPTSAGASANKALVSDGTNYALSAGTVFGTLATADIAATASATGATTLFTPSADGMYRISIYLKITTTGTSPVAGPVTITYTDADGSVAQSHTMLLQSVTGTVVTTTVNNSTTTGTVNGSMVVNAKSGVAIQYAIAVSGTFGSGRYQAHLVCERIK